MAQLVWVVEHRYWKPCGCLDCCSLYLTSTLESAEQKLREEKGAPEREGFYAIYPDVLDGDYFGDEFPEALNERGNMFLQFYDLKGNKLPEQPVPEQFPDA